MKPIHKLEFWKERIDKAAKEHYSVYVTNESHWERINAVHKELLEKLVTGKVLDAGCGYGRWSELFSDYTGVDFSPDFIALAQKKYPQKNFLVANLKALPFADKEFDWAFCVSIKKMVCDNLGEAEWEQMQTELKRVAQQVLILEYEDPEPYEII
jgi:malonyl-CoA O-methyltransferase